ncbi:hypothetical protein EVAR_16567_1 [Eumeta japonica]|uniref:Uncharacterized protein n=1 Tax=Eumeta variegata TaxID=151549 RepID=A0A4C1U3R1_EUMVA|nr:hypothetical protein EVAR_16567_1 [Eumeta japonica]
MSAQSNFESISGPYNLTRNSVLRNRVFVVRATAADGADGVRARRVTQRRSGRTFSSPRRHRPLTPRKESDADAAPVQWTLAYDDKLKII